ncbi:hypothetical protein V6N13_015774 [Hibiscus sabdariffa]|uniref:Uncharacterized protein n=1 Tax=Hibiscus sabdariffa TaxID=183260 RepID=A0ABR2CWN0_9ROSI
MIRRKGKSGNSGSRLLAGGTWRFTSRRHMVSVGRGHVLIARTEDSVVSGLSDSPSRLSSSGHVASPVSTQLR